MSDECHRCGGEIMIKWITIKSPLTAEYGDEGTWEDDGTRIHEKKLAETKPRCNRCGALVRT